MNESLVQDGQAFANHDDYAKVIWREYLYILEKYTMLSLINRKNNISPHSIKHYYIIYILVIKYKLFQKRNILHTIILSYLPLIFTFKILIYPISLMQTALLLI